MTTAILAISATRSNRSAVMAAIDGWPVLPPTRGRSLRLRDNQRSQGMQTDDVMIASSLAHQFVRLV
jgi:hypothetical protein